MSIIPDVSAETSSPYYRVGVKLTYEQNTSNHPTGKVTVQALLCRVQTSARRYQHSWYTSFALDANPNTVKTISYTGEGSESLPNDTALAGTVSRGHLDMEVNKWYCWGAPYVWYIDNDGGTHIFGVRLVCIGVSPNTCPKTDYLYAPLTLAKYTQPSTEVIPPAPTGVYTEFNPITRELKYYWDELPCTYITLWRNLQVNGVTVSSGFVSPNADGKLYYKDKPYTEKLPDDVSGVTYEMINYNSATAKASSGTKVALWHIQGTTTPTTVFPSNNRVKINTNGGWQYAVPWIKTDKGWKIAMTAYVKAPSGAWIKTII